MKRNPLIFVSLIISVFIISGCHVRQDKLGAREQCFNTGWRFMRADIEEAFQPDFDDSGWRHVDLPHDWSIEDLPGEDSQEQIGPFSKESPGKTSTGHVMGGTGWYRKHFSLDPMQDGKIVILHFDGVYMESDLWVNGQHAGFHSYGYTPFYYDITSYLNPAGQPNVLAMRVKNTGRNSRWYSGSGIYRNVTITVTDPLHVAPRGLYITTPQVSVDSAAVQMELSIINDSSQKTDVQARIHILDQDGRRISKEIRSVEIPPKKSVVIHQSLHVSDPLLWSPVTPNLYTARIQLIRDGQVVDDLSEIFGIRSIEFSAEKGFLLNGESVELLGGCLHHDNGILGSAAFERAEERRVQTMKQNGFNAIRTSHNPPSKYFLEACDKLGVLVMDEAFDQWERPKNDMDYHRFFKSEWKKDLTSMILRDRNHPSVICWSYGNEINERADTSGVRIAKQIIRVIKDLDDTRPVTNAICGFWDHPGRPWSDTAPAFEVMDIHSYNYQWRQYEPDHEKYPERIIAGTESVPLEALENYRMVETYPWVIGDFVWTGMDYLGETGIGHAVYLIPGEKDQFAVDWPTYVAWCGDIDICGDKKPQSFYRDVVWRRSDIEMMVHEPIPAGREERVSYWGWPNELPHWNWSGNEDQKLQVTVYTRSAGVQLYLNGELLEEKNVPDSSITVHFEVPYQQGELKAVALKNGHPTAEKVLTTTGKAAKIRLHPERSIILADRGEIVYVRAELLDKDGLLVPDQDVKLSLSVSGEGELLAAGNAGPDQMESVQDSKCRTFRGRALMILRSTGKQGNISLKIESDGLAGDEVLIQAKRQTSS